MRGFSIRGFCEVKEKGEIERENKQREGEKLAVFSCRFIRICVDLLAFAGKFRS